MFLSPGFWPSSTAVTTYAHSTDADIFATGAAYCSYFACQSISLCTWHSTSPAVYLVYAVTYVNQACTTADGYLEAHARELEHRLEMLMHAHARAVVR